VTGERFEAVVPGGRLAGVSLGEGPAVVLLHGLGVERSIWDALLAPLAEDHRVIAFDQRGHGESSPADAPYARHDDLVGVLDALGIARARLVGSSMGGEVALDTALAHPARVEGLVLLDPSLGGHRWSAAWRDSIRGIREAAAERGPEAGKRAWFEHSLFAPARAGEASRARLEASISADSGRRWLEKDPALALEPPARARLADVRCPVTVAVGELDLEDFHAIARALGEGIPGAHRIELLGVGHLPMLEQPARTTGLVRSILAGAAPRA
jgi:pimeloyl-ACP methyl ester carboxylesterase